MATVDELIKSQAAAAQKNASPTSADAASPTTPAAPTTPTTPAASDTTTPATGTTTPAAEAPAETPAATPASTPTEGENRINSMYDAQREAQLKQLENSYNQSLSAAQEARDKIAPQYKASANDLAVQYERNRRNFNQQAAADGINTGTASQAALAQNSAYQRDFGNLRKSESEALASADRGIADLTTKYQNDISSAIADNDYKRAAAMLDEYNNQYKKNMTQAEILASYGDFSMYEILFGKDQADKMRASWAASNPDLAHMTGSITNDQYDNLVNGRPMNEDLDENGNRIPGTGGYGGGGYTRATSDALREQYWQMRNDEVAAGRDPDQATKDALEQMGRLNF